jgi:hypothetical protein
MSIVIEKKFAIEIVYNGLTKSIHVDLEEHVSALIQKAIAAFAITQNPHLLSLYRQDGNVIPENDSVERAGIKKGDILLLRPNAVKGGSTRVNITEDILRTTFQILRDCGRGHTECAVFWSGPANNALVDGVEHPIHERSPFGYEVETNWLTDFCKRLGSSNRSVKVQVHSHPTIAFHSTTDDTWPIVSQPGFLSIVIPTFAMGEPSLKGAWIGRLRADGKWRRARSSVEIVVPA